MVGFVKQNAVKKFAAMATVAAVLATSALPAFAVTQGTVGSTSTGSLSITVTVPSLARITKLADIALGSWSGTGAVSGSANAICVWSSTGGYSLTASGSGAANAFTLASGANTLAYSVQWAQTGGASSGSAVTSGTALTGQTTNATSTDCSSGVASTAGVFVSIPEANLAAKPAGAYTGTLTLLVTPT